MKKTVLFIFLIITSNKIFAQQNASANFYKALETYHAQPYEEIEESTAWKEVVNQFENMLLLNAEMTVDASKKLENSFDNMYAINYTKSADGLFEMVTLSNHQHFYHSNYVMDTSNKQRKIIIKEVKHHQYYTGIYTITDDLFLLMEQMDELVFSCNYASVYQNKKNNVKKINAFNGKTQLTICNFTNIETGTNAESLPVKKISFNEKTKIISYSSCTNFETGETTQPKAVFKNNNFDIEDCDDRKGF